MAAKLGRSQSQRSVTLLDSWFVHEENGKGKIADGKRKACRIERENKGAEGAHGGKSGPGKPRNSEQYQLEQITRCFIR